MFWGYKLHTYNLTIDRDNVTNGKTLQNNAGIDPSTVLTFTFTDKYYAGNNAAVEAVEVMADGVKAVTDGEGKASLVVATKNVVVTVSKLTSANAVTAFDASLVLQSAVDKITLNENQLLAADVDGNGTVNEYDAALILQKAVRKIDSFPCGKSWIFVPAYIEKTLSATSTNNVSFTAISVGDVDGSFAGE